MAGRSLRLARLGLILGAIVGALFILPSVVAAANPDDIGYVGPSFTGGGGSPSGSKPQSKLWFNDGTWWASMWDVATNDFYIWSLDPNSGVWTRTNTRLDDRSATRADVLWDATAGKLYVASHQFSEGFGSGQSRLYRYSYDATSGTYTLDGGFPAVINSVKSETLAIAKDSTGRLWATWTWRSGSGSPTNVFIAHTTTDDTTWSAPIVLPNSQSVSSDDISSIIAFGGNKIGVAWSDQSHDKDFFSIHIDGTADTAWSSPPEVALSGSGLSDDHINLKTDSSGRVYSVVKTSLSGSADPLIELLVRSASGTWSNYVVATHADNHTRPILELDLTNNLFRVLLTHGQSGGSINEKTSSMSAIGFGSGQGSIIIQDASVLDMNNASSTKQNVTAATGLFVIATNDSTTRYWTSANLIPSGGGGNTPPAASATSATTTQDSPVSVALGGTDAEDCELTFSIVTPPAHGTLGSISSPACTPGSPNQDTATVTYTPASGYSGSDSFTYRVDDGMTSSPAATASLTINPVSSGGGSIAFRSATSAANDGTTSLTISRPAGTASGDVLLASIAARGNPAITAPSGWSLVRLDANGNTLRQAVYVRVATSSEPATYTWTFSKSETATGGISAFSGVDTTNPIDASGGQGNASSDLLTAPSITTTGTNRMLVALFGTAVVTSITPPGGESERFDIASPTSNRYKLTSEAADETRASSGATGSRVATAANSGASVGQLVALRPAAGAPNTAPTATGGSPTTTSEDTPLTVTLGGSDPETCELTFTIVTPPSHGTLGSIGNTACVSGSPNTDSATVTYTPAANENGPDSFSYKVGDGMTESSPVSVNLTVSPVNDVPTASAGTESTTVDTPIPVHLGGSDVETCELTFNVPATTAQGGTLSGLTGAACVPGTPDTDTATVTYTPPAAFTGSDSFTYTVGDGTATSSTATISISVGAPPSGISFRSSSTGTNATATTLVIPKPAGVASGDVLVASVSVRGSPTITPPSGWTSVVDTPNGSVIRQAVFVHVAGASEPASYTWTFSKAQSAAGGVSAYQGVDTANPIDASGGQANPSSSTIAAPSITTTHDGDLIVGFFGIATIADLTPPGSMAERFDVAVPSTNQYKASAESADETQASAGTTGPRAATADHSAASVGQLVALRPA